MPRPAVQQAVITPFTTWLNQKLAGVEPATIAKAAQLSLSYLSLLRRGQRKPSESAVRAIAGAFHSGPEELADALAAAGIGAPRRQGPDEGKAAEAQTTAPGRLSFERLARVLSEACDFPFEYVTDLPHAKEENVVLSDVRVNGRAVGHIRTPVAPEFESHREMLKRLASLAAMCLELNVQSQREIAAIGNLAVSLSSTARIEDLLCALLDKVSLLITFDFGHITLVDKENQELVVLAEKSDREEPSVPASQLRSLSPLRWKLSAGITGLSATDGRPVRIGDVRRVPYFIGHYPTLSELAVPMKAPHVIGVINLESRQLDQFTEHDEQLLVIAAAMVSNAVQRSLEVTRENQWQDRFTALAELHSLAADAKGGPKEFLQKLADRVVRLFPEFHVCVVRLHDEENGVLLLMGAATRDADDPASIEKSLVDVMPVGSSISGRAIQSGKAEIVLDVQSDRRYYGEKLAIARGLRSMLVVPIPSASGGAPIGCIAVYSTSAETRFQDEHVRLLDDLARFLTFVLTYLRETGGRLDASPV